MTQLRRRPLKPAAISLFGAALLAYSGGAVAIDSYQTAFQNVYPAAVGTRIDECNLCHTADEEDADGNLIIDFSSRNPYGADFERIIGHFNTPEAALRDIEPFDSDNDAQCEETPPEGLSNLTEINNLTFPGDINDPTCTIPPPPQQAWDYCASDVVVADCGLQVDGHLFSILDIQGNFEGDTFATNPAILCDAPGSTVTCPDPATDPVCQQEGLGDCLLPVATEIGTLWPANHEFGFYIVDFIGGFQKDEADGIYGEGWAGDYINPDTNEPIGLLTSNIATPRFASGAPLGTSCAGMGGNDIKCETEHYTVLEHILTCFETVPYFYGIIDLDVDPAVCAVNPLDNTFDEPPAGLEPNESNLTQIAVGPDYSVTLKDDGKVLYRWGTQVKRPTDMRMYVQMPLPAEWKEAGADFTVTKAELHVQHWITNNPNDQLRPEDMENEGATGRKPDYAVLPADVPNINGEAGDWVSTRDCFEGDGDFIPAGTLYKDASFVAPSPEFDELCIDGDCLSEDLDKGLTNGWYTTTQREPFEWSYFDADTDGDGIVEPGLSGTRVPLADVEDRCILNADGTYVDADPLTAGCLVSGPRWRLTAQKFGQDVPALEIPLIECSPTPIRSDNIKYVVGVPTTTIINLLDFGDVNGNGDLTDDSPLLSSKGWVYASENFQNLDANGDPTCGGATDTNCVSTNGVPMSTDFDLAVYTKGDRKPLAILNAALYINYAGAPAPTPSTDAAVTELEAPSDLRPGEPGEVKVKVVNVGTVTVSGEVALVADLQIGEDQTYSLGFANLAPGGEREMTQDWIAPSVPQTVTWTATVVVPDDGNAANDTLVDQTSVRGRPVRATATRRGGARR